MSRKGWLLFVSLCVVWGLPYLFIRIAVRELSPPSLVFLRTGCAALVLLPFAVRRGRARDLLPRWRWLLSYTLIELCVPWFLLAHAERTISSSLAGLLVATVPLIGAVLYRAAGVADHFDARRLVGLGIGFAGVAALVGLDVGASDPLAMAEVGVVALCYATGPLLVARGLSDVPAIGVITASLVGTAVLFATPGIALLPASLSATTIAAVAVLAVVPTALAFLLFFALIAEVGPSRTTVITYVNPLVAVLLGVVFLSEPFTLGIAVGMPLILLGSVLGTARTKRDAGLPPAHEATAAGAPGKPGGPPSP